LIDWWIDFTTKTVLESHVTCVYYCYCLMSLMSPSYFIYRFPWFLTDFVRRHHSSFWLLLVSILLTSKALSYVRSSLANGYRHTDKLLLGCHTTACCSPHKQICLPTELSAFIHVWSRISPRHSLPPYSLPLSITNRFYRAMHLVQSAVLRSHIVCLSVCPSVCDVGELWSHRLEFFESNSTIS